MESRIGADGLACQPQFDLNLHPQLVQELLDSFKFFDRDSDGVISKEELGDVVRSLGQKLSDADLDALMREVDTNGDGVIDFQEFLDLNTRAMEAECNPVDASRNSCSNSLHLDREESNPSPVDSSAVLSAFNVFDVDKNGLISAEELHFVLAGFGDENVSVDDCRSMIRCVDADGDQMVNLREFAALMNGSFVF